MRGVGEMSEKTLRASGVRCKTESSASVSPALVRTALLDAGERPALPVKSLALLLLLCFLASCATIPSGAETARLTTARAIAAEPLGDYFIGRRYFNRAYHFWGYVRRPGQPWNVAVLVVLNENRKLAPDRSQLNFGIDNNYEYKLHGHFSGDKIYELVSDAVYPEFVLTGYELLSTNPPPIFKSQISGKPAGPFQIEKPDL